MWGGIIQQIGHLESSGCSYLNPADFFLFRAIQDILLLKLGDGKQWLELYWRKEQKKESKSRVPGFFSEKIFYSVFSDKSVED